MRRLSEAVLRGDPPRETGGNRVDVTVSRDQPGSLIGPRRRVETRVLAPQFGPPVKGPAQRARQRRTAGPRRTRGRVDRERLLRERSAEMSAGQRQVQRRGR